MSVFNQEEHSLLHWRAGLHLNCTWRGVKLKQHPADLIALQMLLYKLQPQAVVETGTFAGGSALFFYDVMRLWTTSPWVFSVDIEGPDRDLLSHGQLKSFPFIQLVQGDSKKAEIGESVVERLGAFGLHKLFVFLDSYHSHDHVCGELEAFRSVLDKGGHVMVADTIILKPSDKELGPGRGLNDFLRKYPQYERVPDWNPFGLSSFLDGLIRKKAQ